MRLGYPSRTPRELEVPCPPLRLPRTLSIVRIRSLARLAWIAVGVACSSATSPGHSVIGTWVRSDNNDTTWFEQHGTDVAGWWAPDGVEQLICGTVSGSTVMLTLYPEGATYEGTFSGDALITGTETDSGGTAPYALNFSRVVADTPSMLGLGGGNCAGFPYNRVRYDRVR